MSSNSSYYFEVLNEEVSCLTDTVSAAQRTRPTIYPASGKSMLARPAGVQRAACAPAAVGCVVDHGQIDRRTVEL